MTRTVIGLTGAAGSGKSTVAKRLVEQLDAIRRPMAEPLKRMLADILGRRGASPAEIDRMLHGDLKEVPSRWLNGETPRRAMQTLGDWGRALSEDFWVDVWRDSIRSDVAEPPAGFDVIVVVDDVRYPNEVKAIRAMSGCLARVVRPRAGLSGAAGNHSSETTALGEPDLTIVNDRSIDDLIADVDRWLGPST